MELEERISSILWLSVADSTTSPSRARARVFCKKFL